MKKGMYLSKAFGQIPVYIIGYPEDGVEFKGRNWVMDKLIDAVVLFDIHVMHMDGFTVLEEVE